MTYTIIKYTRDAEPELTECDRTTADTWDDAVQAALDMGAIPGTGMVDGPMFRTADGCRVSVESE